MGFRSSSPKALVAVVAAAAALAAFALRRLSFEARMARHA
jgi:hypothetical protein